MVECICLTNTYLQTLIYSQLYTVKPLYKDHFRDQVIVVSVDSWSLYGGVLIQLKWTMSQSTEVSIDRWSLYASGLLDRFYCTGKMTVIVLRGTADPTLLCRATGMHPHFRPDLLPCAF